MYTVKEFAKLLKVNPATIRRWEKAGIVNPIILPNGYRRYTDEDYNKLVAR